MKPVYIMGGGILAVLVVASIAWRVLAALKPQSDFTELKLRIRTWWIMAGMFFTALLIDQRITIVFFAFTSFMALKEYFSLIPTRRADRRALFWAYLSIPVQYAFVASGWYGMFVLFVPLYMFLIIPTRMVLIQDTHDFLKSASIIHWGTMMAVFSLSHIPAFLTLPLKVTPPAGGAGLILFVVVLTQANDVAQYIWGKSFGRHKVIPKVSPGKTYEGLLGGVGTTMVLATVLGPYLTPMSTLDSLKAGVIVGFGGFLGDITISAVKRDIGVKDSGNILPGHGGMLDRVDSLLFTAPLIFHFVRFLYGAPLGAVAGQ